MKPLIYSLGGAIVGAAIATGATLYVVKHPDGLTGKPVPQWVRALPMMNFQERHVSQTNERAIYLLKPPGQGESPLPEIWVRTEFRDPMMPGAAVDGQYFSTVMKIRVNCADQRFQVIRAVAYTEHNATGNFRELPTQQVWEEPIPNSGGEHAITFACPKA